MSLDQPLLLNLLPNVPFASHEGLITEKGYKYNALLKLWGARLPKMVLRSSLNAYTQVCFDGESYPRAIRPYGSEA